MLPVEERLFELITVALSVTICASHERVWRALVDPAERPLWDDRILGEVDLASRSKNSARTSRRRSSDRSARSALPALPEAAAMSNAAALNNAAALSNAAALNVAAAPDNDTAPRDAATRTAGAQTAPAALKESAPRKSSLRTTKWRFRFGAVPLVMKEDVVSADRHDRLDSRVSIGTMHFDQTLTFHTEDDETGPRTRLGMKIIAHNSIAVIGDIVPRLDVQKIVIEYVDTTLRQAQKYCEQEP